VEAGRVARVKPLDERFPRPTVVGIVNVTPDSFSGDGVVDAAVAAAQARRIIAEGAGLVDVGGESTRPGSDGVSLDEELRRVVPVLEAIGGELPISIDTSKAEVARRAIELGAVMVNDVTALRGDPELAGVVVESRAYLCLMHMLGEPRTMQDDPRYADVVSEVARFLEERLSFAVDAGMAEERICLDPGIGFGKSVEHNLAIIRRVGEIVRLGRPVMVGASRKRFLGRILGDPEALTGPVSAAVATSVLAYERGASLFRVHDVREHAEALAATRALVAAP
jgi:dihydropteroate synthase